jgi:pimeloyl-ACP methyl ester carboxylesterase
VSKYHRLIVPDLPGHGRPAALRGDFRHRQAAHDVYALLDHLAMDSEREPR